MARRISKSSVNWAFVAESFVNKDKQIAITIKAKSDKYLRQLEDKPAELPKIDWNLYKSRISAPGMVELFQKSYETMKIPYPSDQGALAETEKHNAKLLENADKNSNKILEIIRKSEERLKVLAAEMRYVDMSMEEFFLARPDIKINADKPEHWPHLFHRQMKMEENESGGH